MERTDKVRSMSAHVRRDELQTERLILRPLELADAEQTQRLFPQWEIVKFLNAKVLWPFPADGALTYYRDSALPAIERGEEWHWTLRLKESPAEHIGSICLVKGETTNRGFWLGLPWQGRGLMTEAVAAVNDYWFDVLGFRVLRAPKAIANVESRRISEKTGMRVIAVHESDYVSGRFMSEIWRSRRKSGARSGTAFSPPCARDEILTA
jgi:[ribosomal protein S5]-alanine N-acetyltransferase